MRRELRAVVTRQQVGGDRPRSVLRVGAGAALLGVAVGVLAASTWALGPAGGVVVTFGVLMSGALFSKALVAADDSTDGRSTLDNELERARRFGHPLTLVRLPSVGPEAGSFVSHPSTRTGLARRIDQAWIEGDDLYITLYDTGADGAALVLGRLRAYGISSEGTQLAVFPDSALTAGELRRQVNVTPPNGATPITGVSAESAHARARRRAIAELPPSAAR